MWTEIVPFLKRCWSPQTTVCVMRRNGKDCVSAEWIYHIVGMDKEHGGTLHTPPAPTISDTDDGQ